MQEEIFIPKQSAKILVVGDIILDQYLYGETSRISPEAPVPVVRVSQQEERPGGAANVALNIASLDMPVTLLGLTGDDEASQRLENILNQHNVSCHFTRQYQVPTITKVRILSQHQQLLRLDYENDNISTYSSNVVDQFEMLLADMSLIVLSDYAKGSLRHIEKIIARANKKNIPIFVDPKSNDFNIYRNTDLITPNLKEFRAVVGNVSTTEEIVNAAIGLCKKYNLKALLVTRGENGMSLVKSNGDNFHLKAQAHEVYDVTGAGDTVIATLAASFASEYTIEQSVSLSNIAAGLVVEKLGAAIVTTAELNTRQNSFQSSGKVITQSDIAVTLVNEYKSQGQRIVFTNGCFDILHAGHVTYLEKARSIGDKLIVAVNSDASVSRLKGQDRPVNDLANRMKLLSALSCVDIVVPFEEDTPKELIEALLPNVLVKGGDYSEEQIVGADVVRDNGGEIKILNFEEGYSTSSIVNKIKQSG